MTITLGVIGMQTNYPKELSKEMLFAWLRRLGEQYQTSFVVSDPDLPDNPLVYVNDAFIRMSGYDKDELIGKNCRFLQGPDTDIGSVKFLKSKMDKEMPVHTEVLNYRKDGTPFWNELVIQPLRDEAGTLLFYIGLQLDVTNRKQTEALFLVQQEIYQGIDKGYALTILLQKICDLAESFFQQGTKCSVLLVDEDERLVVAAAKSLPTEFNQAIHGRKIGPNAGSCGTAAYIKKPVIVTDIATDPLWTNYKDIALPHDLRACWSMPILTSDNKIVGTFATYFSTINKPRAVDLEFIQRLIPLISLSVKNAEHQDEILRLAYIDSDTDLPNRHYFTNELKDILIARKNGCIAILEPSEFAKIVDIYGRHAGDDLIKQLGQRIRRTCKGTHDVIARFASSALIFVSVLPLKDVESYAAKIAQIATDPFLVADAEVFVTLKMGVTTFTKQDNSADELIRYADTALSDAKKRLGNSISFFESTQDVAAKHEMTIFNHLSHAIQRQEFDIHLQPKVNLSTGEIFSFEALARWTSPDLGIIPPSVFIQAAENAGKIRSIEMQVLHKVLNWLSNRKNAGQKLYQVAINISTDHFFHPDFINDLVNTVKDYKIDPQYIRVEITESIGLVDFELAKLIFGQLRLAGFESSVDDFGMGFSSLSYIQQLPFTEIKIDRSFISKIDHEGTLAIVRTIIQLANNLNMESIAEGIETVEQLTILRSMGCQSGQGFYFYKPMPLNEVDELLRLQL